MLQDDSAKSHLTFKVNLWDKYQQIHDRIFKGKESVKEIQAMVKNQNYYQLELGKQFAKQKLNSDKTLGVLVQPMQKTLTFVVKTGEKHNAVAAELLNNLYKELTTLRKELSTSLKSANKEEAKFKAELAAAQKTAKAAKQKDIDDKKNYEKHKLAESKAPSDLPPKKLAALKKAAEDADKQQKKSEQDYKNAISKLHATDKGYYEKLGSLMGTLENLDRKRVNTVKSILERYATLQYDLAQLMLEHAQQMKEQFAKIDAEEDIQTFIHETQSGAVPPPPADFEPYQPNLPDEIAQNQRFSTRSTSATDVKVSAAPVVSITTNNKPSPPPADEYVDVKTSTAILDTKPDVSSKPVIKQVRSLYDYNPENPEELTLAAGEIVNVLEENSDGWWLGEVRGKQGYFPSNFIEELGSAPAVSAPNPVPSKTTNDSVGGHRATALYDYDATDSNELSFKEGELIEVLQQHDDGWWLGKIGGRQGLFPSNYVQ